MTNILISLSDGDKRLIFALLLIVIILLVFIGLLGYLLMRIMKFQAKKIDTLVHDAVVTKVVNDKRHFIRYGRNKNWAYFFKQAYIPMIIIIVGFIFLFIHNAIYNNWGYNPLSTYDGFGTLFFTWKLSGEYTEGTLIKFAKLVLDNTPHFNAIAWCGYIFGPCILVGGTWYLVAASSLLARTVLLYKRSKTVFEKSLDGYHQDEALTNNNNTNTNN